MSKFARVTLTSGETFDPVLVWDDGRGLRFYASGRGGIRLLGAVFGARVTSWGERRRLEPRGPRVELPTEISGEYPSDFAQVVALRGCQCGHPLKKFRPPTAWEEVPA